MVVKKRKKSTRQHGSGLHGWGRNKHRNSGQRGGYGNAGTGKKNQGKKTSVWGADYFGKKGFIKKGIKIEEHPINLKEVDHKIPNWLDQKKASKEADKIILDLTALGYTKLLGTGKLTRKVKITVAKAAAGATEKIKQAGGELIVK